MFCVLACVLACVCTCVHLRILYSSCLFSIEYVGNVPPELRDSLLSDLNQQTARLIQVAAKGQGRRGTWGQGRHKSRRGRGGKK